MNTSKKLILVVEDNPDNHQLVRKILEHHGFAIEVIENGEAALAWCSENLPDLILMDISLPEMDGLEVTRQLRQNPKYADLPIISLTAHAMSNWDEKIKQAGCTDSMSKPFLPSDLAAIVKKYTV